MSTPKLLNLPSSACVGSVVIGITRVVGKTQSPFTLEEQTFKWPGEQWNIDFQMPPFKNKVIAAEWKAFGVALQGTYNRFLMGDPSAKQPNGVATGTPLVDEANQTGNVLKTKGWTPSTAGILLAGDYIQIGEGIASRLHMVIEDANSDASGLANLSIEPALRYSPTDNTPITVNYPKGVFRLAGNTWSWSAEPGPLYRMSFQAVEVPNA